MIACFVERVTAFVVKGLCLRAISGTQLAFSGGMKKRKERILIADDDEKIRFGIIRYLRLEGYSVESADDGMEAFDKIAGARKSNNPYDLLICDLNMPRLRGEELMRKLKEQGVHLPVLIVSGSDDYETDANSRFIRKPFDPKQLMESVTVLLGKELHKTV